MSKLWNLVAAFFLIFVSTFCFADVLPGSQHIIDWLSSPPVAIITIIEFILRIVPSKKPLSVLYLAGQVASKLGAILVAAGAFLDKLVGQNLSQ